MITTSLPDLAKPSRTSKKPKTVVLEPEYLNNNQDKSLITLTIRGETILPSAECLSLFPGLGEGFAYFLLKLWVLHIKLYILQAGKVSDLMLW